MPKQRRSPGPPGRRPAAAARPPGVPWWLVVAVVVLVTAAWPGGVVEAQEAVFARYAGSETCRACHAPEHAAWVASHHGLAERLVQDGLERPAFDTARAFTHGS